MFVDSVDSDRELVIESCRRLIIAILPFYFICGMMNSVSGAMRGIGYSILPMITSVIGVCGLRALWIYTAFTLPPLHTMPGLYLSYPITWAITTIALTVEFFIVYKKLMKQKESSLS
jgi:Na+-driven multidrug efflux pump